MKYNAISTKRANEIADQVIAHNFHNMMEFSDWAYEQGFDVSEWGIAKSVMEYGDQILPFAEQDFYRIGEPAFDNAECIYRSSYNYADQKRESGVSVVTTAWLHSLKSVFFGTDADTLRARGIYKIRGFVVGFGGDDEPVIYPTNFAEKLKVHSRTALEKLVK